MSDATGRSSCKSSVQSCEIWRQSSVPTKSAHSHHQPRLILNARDSHHVSARVRMYLRVLHDAVANIRVRLHLHPLAWNAYTASEQNLATHLFGEAKTSLANRCCSGYKPTCTPPGTWSPIETAIEGLMRRLIWQQQPATICGGHSIHKTCRRVRPLAQCVRWLSAAVGSG